MPNPPRSNWLITFGKLIARCVYKVSVHGLANLPREGFLLLPNHVTWVDAIILQVACPRPIRFVVDESIYHKPLLNPLFRFLKAIPICPARAKEGVREAAARIQQGEIVCIFPEGELSRTGTLLRLKRGYELIARTAQAQVVPVWLDQLWGSIFSFYGGTYFKKLPRKWPYPVAVAFGAPLPAQKANIHAVRQELLELGEFCFQKRPLFEGHIARAALRGLKHGQFRTAIIDGTDNSTISRGMLLAASIALAGYLKRRCIAPRIAAVLPTGKGSVIANLAILLSGKVPVNLNFTAGNAAIQAAMRIGMIADAITAKAFANRLSDFPFPDHIICLGEVLPALKGRIVLWRILVALLPWWILTALLKIPKKGNRAEAIVLFTSGSSGEPKGVVLSHRNILSNVTQFSSMLCLKRSDTVLAALPFFHSFGCTVTLWYPLIEGVRIVTYPNPLDVVKNAELIQRHQITMLLATPTFLRGYLRKAKKEQLASLKLVVTGAEKLQDTLAEAFYQRFGKVVEQGYGLTETSPVVSVNLPEPAPYNPNDSVQPSSRRGSVGKLAPGIAAQIRDPETGEILPSDSIGMLWLRGPNMFEGYLNDPQRTAEVYLDGWFRTGDLARFDEDGFLYIEGRLSRFSKIGGEMVPHETVEANIVQALDLPHEGDRVVAVLGVPDETKGEALVLLTTTNIDPNLLRQKLADAGMPNLWIPRKIRHVETIPVLGSGKLDLKACKSLVGQ